MDFNCMLLLAFAIKMATPAFSINNEQFVYNISKSGKTFLLPASKTSPCPSRCQCDRSREKVDCSRLGLNFVPTSLPSTTRWLILSRNNFTKLTNGMFKHVPMLTYLDLSINSIRQVENRVFEYVPALQRLDLSDNPLGNYQIIRHIFCGLNKTAIKELTLKNVSFVHLKQSTLKCLEDLSITHLNLSFNHKIGSLWHGAFSKVYTLERLELRANTLNKLNPRAFEGLEHFHELLLSFNRIDVLPEFSNGNTSLLPNLMELYLNQNLIRSIQASKFRGLNSLEKIDLSNNYIASLGKNLLRHLPSLRIFKIGGNKLNQIQPEAFTSSRLTKIDISANVMTFTQSSVDLFRKAEQLQKIHIYNNKKVDDEFLEVAFQNLTCLKELLLGHLGDISTVPANAFRNLNNLTSLGLSSNSLTSLHMNTFKDLTSLRYLYINGNSLTNINITSFPPKVLGSLKKLDLSNNPYLCDCNLFWFLEWFKANHKKIVRYNVKNAYICIAPERKQLKDFHPTADECLYKDLSLGLLFSMLLSSMTVVFSALASGFYRWRWTLRYHLFHLNSWWTATRAFKATSSETLTEDYTFDVFVGYNSEDSAWVNEILLVELEQRSAPPFKLCLYERDWLPGQNIINCIGESIEKSRKILLIVTNAFAQSQWCQLELTMAQYQLFEGDKDNLILAIMEDIDPLNMAPRLALEMKRRIYLSWTEDEVGKVLFWEKLRTTLRQTSLSVQAAMPTPEEFCD